MKRTFGAIAACALAVALHGTTPLHADESQALTYGGTIGAAKGLTKDSPAMWTTFPISYYKEKLNAETPLPRSGLIGPVRLMAEGVVSLDGIIRR